MRQSDDLLIRRAEIWRRWEGTGGPTTVLRSRAFWEQSRPQDLAFAAQVFLLLALTPLELTLWGWASNVWGLATLLRGWGELVLIAWLVVWLWSIWRWLPVLPSRVHALVAGVPVFGLPLVGGWGWLEHRRPVLQPPPLKLGRALVEIPRRKSIRDTNFLLLFLVGVVLTLLGVAWLVDPQMKSPGCEAFRWLGVILLHALGWSVTRKPIWLLPWPLPMISFLRELLETRESRARKKSITWQAFVATATNRRWARWDRLGQSLHQAWERVPWRLRWRGGGRAAETELTRSQRRRRSLAWWQRALSLPESILAGFCLAAFNGARLVEPNGAFSPLGQVVLKVLILLVLLGLIPGLIYLGSRTLALSRRRFAEAARTGLRLALVAYLVIFGLLTGHFLAIGDLVEAGVMLVLGMALLLAIYGLSIVMRSALNLLPGGWAGSREKPSLVRFLTASFVALMWAAMILLPGWIGNLAASFVFQAALVSPAIHYVLWRLSWR